jgi:hypothetical protein
VRAGCCRRIVSRVEGGSCSLFSKLIRNFSTPTMDFLAQEQWVVIKTWSTARCPRPVAHSNVCSEQRWGLLFTNDGTLDVDPSHARIVLRNLTLGLICRA